MLAVCDHRCQFTYVDVGRAGCVGDAFSYAESSLRRRIIEGRWLRGNVQDFDGTVVTFTYNIHAVRTHSTDRTASYSSRTYHIYDIYAFIILCL